MTLNVPPRHLQLLQKILKEYVPDSEVWAYGSRVDGSAHDASDLDLVLRNPKDLTSPQKKLSPLKEALTESNLPFLVDILDWARLPASFYSEIEKKHCVIQ